MKRPSLASSSSSSKHYTIVLIMDLGTLGEILLKEVAQGLATHSTYPKPERY
jgi:hypothetical protein